jgi:hypothetical protein
MRGRYAFLHTLVVPDQINSFSQFYEPECSLSSSQGFWQKFVVRAALKRRFCYLPSATGFPSGPFLSDIPFRTPYACHSASSVTSSVCKLLVSGLSPRRPRFNLRLMHLRFVVDRVALEQASYQIRRSSPVCVIQHTLQTFSIFWTASI